jgi:hypothetical protein
VELREPEADRLRRIVNVGVVLLAAVTAAYLYLRISEWRGALSCGASYATAYTASDTLIIDAQGSGASSGRLDTASNGSCGELRLRGMLR